MPCPCRVPTLSLVDLEVTVPRGPRSVPPLIYASVLEGVFGLFGSVCDISCRGPALVAEG